MMELALKPQERLQLAAVYDLLSRLWLKEVDRSVIQVLSESEMRNAWEAMGGVVPAEDDEEHIEELAIDFCQLLIGPTNQLVPVQSVWQDQMLQSEPAESMHRYFKLVPGFEPVASIPDHFAVQLQLLSELLQRCDDDQPEIGLAVATEFFDQHLKWSTRFLVAVKEKANTQFYSALATLTYNFLH